MQAALHAVTSGCMLHYMLQACTRWRCRERQTTQVGSGRPYCKGTVPGTGLAWFAGLAACALEAVGDHGPPRERFSATQALQRSLRPAVIRASFRWASVLHDHRGRQQHGPKPGLHSLMDVAVHRCTSTGPGSTTDWCAAVFAKKNGTIPTVIGASRRFPRQATN